MLLEIENFRSIRKQSLELKPLTVVYGPNGAGKSSLIYALLTLKNIVLNSNQLSDAFFNYGIASLGAFDAVVFNHDSKTQVRIKIELPEIANAVAYSVGISKTQAHLELSAGAPYNFSLSLNPALPYAANQQVPHTYKLSSGVINITWNGFLAQVLTGLSDAEGKALVQRLNSCVEAIRHIDLVPLKRGFMKPSYSIVGQTPLLITEDEVATYLANNKYVRGKVNYYLEQVLDRSFNVGFTPGTAIFSLDSTDRRCGVSTELINDGFGVNQLVYLLAKVLKPEATTLCIEEPEINLHPSAIRRLAHLLIAITKEEDKQFVITTHSEPFVLALLTLVKNDKLQPADLGCYLTEKRGRETIFTAQTVEKNGQISGGLRSFMEGELEDLKEFFGLTDEARDELEDRKPASG
jgi:energy-coupling factor transporter ATP-binding protein EcfA2